MGKIDPAVPKVLLTDYTKLSQVLMNLISNSSKFTEDGSITISVDKISGDQEDLKVRFGVLDTGRGILPEDQKKIFEEFMQIKNLDDFEIAGTGLGIPIVNKSNGKEAIALSRQHQFDFILMDINMPVMSGIEATQEIRKFDSHTPIIALTATNFEDPEKEVFSHGFNDIVVKPYNNDHLIQAFLTQLDDDHSNSLNKLAL